LAALGTPDAADRLRGAFAREGRIDTPPRAGDAF
jgi:hypothetical protein